MKDAEQRCCCGGHAAIRIRDLNVKIGAVSILEHVSAVVPRGMCTAVVGPNGAGKTTLTRAILDDIPYRGEIEFGDSSGAFSRKKPRFGYVPQKLNFDRDMPLTVTAPALASAPAISSQEKPRRAR